MKSINTYFYLKRKSPFCVKSDSIFGLKTFCVFCRFEKIRERGSDTMLDTLFSKKGMLVILYTMKVRAKYRDESSVHSKSQQKG